MSTSTLGLFLRHLALSEEVSQLKTVSDHNLLDAYEAERGQAAFTELMRRHGPMVLRTCRRILGRGPDAEDAFQATFVLLAQKAGQLRREVRGALSLGGWLHRVAYQTAVNVLAKSARRRIHERQASVMTHPDPDPAVEATWNEIRPILDAELDALPDEARRLLIACYLREKSYSEVAAELGLPRSSVARHLERARGLLARRLARRGITVSSVLLAVLLEDSAKGAGVPATLLVHTVEAARAFTGQASRMVSENVVRLVKGGLANMAKGWTHLSMALAGWLGLLGVGLIACQTLKAWPDSPPESAPPAAAERSAKAAEKQVRTDCHGDPLPAEALVRMGTTRLRHPNEVHHVLFAPDGKTVASGGYDGTVRLWDAATGKLVHSLKHQHPREIWPCPVSFARDGKTLTSLTNNGQIWQWDVRTGKQLRELTLKVKLSQRGVFPLVVSSDGKMAAAEEESGVVRLWDMATGNPLRVLRGCGKPGSLLSFSLFFSPDNKTLVVAGDDEVVSLWDVPSGKLLHKLEHPLAVSTVSFSPDGKTLASGGSDKTKRFLPSKPEGNPSAVCLWDVATGKLLRALEGHQQVIAALSFSPDGKVLASGSWDKTIRLWDITTGKELRKLKGPRVVSLSFAPDGKVLASASMDPTVRLWDVATGAELRRPGEAHTGQVRSVAFAPDGRTLATAAAREEGDDTVRLWDAGSGKPLRGLNHPETASAVVFAPDGKTLASGGAGVVCIWDATTGQQLRKLESPGGSPLAFSPDGKTLAAGSNEEEGVDGQVSHGILRLWDVATGAQLRTLEHPHHSMCVAFSPDGKTLAVGTMGAIGGTLHLWDAVTGKELLKLDKFTEGRGEIGSLSFAPDGKTLAVGSFRKLRLLEVPTGKELCTLTVPGNHTAVALAFSPSGRWLASANNDQTVRLWEVNAGLASQCHQFRGHAAHVTAVAFSPDGRRLASGSLDSTALVWDVTGRAGKQARASRLTQAELIAFWQFALASTDAAQAYQAMRTLAAAPDQAVPFLAERLLLKKPDSRQVARLLADLDSDDFRVRSQAAKGLAKCGEAVEPALQQALKDNPSVEARRRIQQLLEAIHPLTPEGVSLGLLRWLRALEVLEWIDTLAARELLGKVAAAPPLEEVGREAKAALKRLHALPPLR